MVEGWKSFSQLEPLQLVRTMLRPTTLWWAAEKIIQSAFEHRKTAVQSGHSLSKDWSAGIIALVWLLRYYPSKVILTAPTSRQVVNIMFEELKKQYDNLKKYSPWSIPTDCMKTSMLDLGPEWFALGFTTRESSGGEGGSIGKFQGFKSPNMLVIVSEAQTVEDSIYDAIDGIMTSGNAHILELGNPITPLGRFWHHCTQPRYGYNVIKLSCFQSPNVIAKKEIIPGMVTHEWVEDKRSVWGEEHPYWYSRVLGQFPQSSQDSIIPIEWIMRAVNREILPEDNDDVRVGGLDVSKKGHDETVHVTLKGKKIDKIQGFFKVDINETVGWARELIKSDRLQGYGVDEGGLAGVAGFLEEGPDLDFCRIVRIQFGEAVEHLDFANLAALMWWRLREAFQNNVISIPDDPILIGQLSSRKYQFTSKGKQKIKLESKADAKTRGIESPDRGDGLAMAWYVRILILTDTDLMSDKLITDSAAVQEEIDSIHGRGDNVVDADSIRY